MDECNLWDYDGC